MGAQRVAGERRSWIGWRTVLRVVGLVAVLAVIVAVLSGKLPSPQQVWTALRTANWWWVALAAGTEVASIGMVIRQQRRLLRAFGVPVTYRRMGAITYSSTALAVSMPAGGAVSAGYSYRAYRASGASPRTAATVMLLSGVLSILALGLLYLVGLGAAALTPLMQLGARHPVRAAVVGLVLVQVLVLAGRYLARRERRAAGADADAPTPRLDRYARRHPRLGAVGRQMLDTLRQTRQVRLRDWNLVMTTSAGKWLLDVGCLYLCCLALDLNIRPLPLAAVYLGIQVIRQVPLTPGGIGVIEGALLVGLVSAGAPQGPAAAAVLLYRLFSAWLLIPVGFVLLALLRRRDARRAAIAGQVAPDEPAD